ncbi:unnamed protein product [Phaedon cochleariae]|uniref:Aminotransferase class I/classII large domain-containing protein n=1 Tax=Phaedon cochleariae TaxID=80249 RepID=A0A9P0DW60_PHACE|nr:unnamed protein product [Phaedon cochleariae]
MIILISFQLYQDNLTADAMSLHTNLQEIGDFWKDFAELSALARTYKPIDLGQGCPNFAPSQFIKDALIQAVTSDSTHQYTNPYGHPRLANVLAKLYSRLLNRNVDSASEILITAGSSEALFCYIIGLIGAGDEVIVVQPYFPFFSVLIELAGGVAKFVTLKRPNGDGSQSASDWVLDYEELEGAFTDRTKAIIVNTPNNPIGKVFDRSELERIADLCKKWDVICLADEVYEWMVWEPKEHIRIASLPGMYERTITIGAAEKSFGVTGWQIGWAYGPPSLLKNLKKLHLLSVFNPSTPLQEAFATLFEHEEANFGEPQTHFVTMQRQLKEKMHIIMDLLKKTGMDPVMPDGGMFIVADISKLAPRTDLTAETDDYLDLRFVKWLIKKHKLLGNPMSLFYAGEDKRKNDHFIRFCFYKNEDTLQKAAEILTKLRDDLKL